MASAPCEAAGLAWCFRALPEPCIVPLWHVATAALWGGALAVAMPKDWSLLVIGLLGTEVLILRAPRGFLNLAVGTATVFVVLHFASWVPDPQVRRLVGPLPLAPITVEQLNELGEEQVPLVLARDEQLRMPVSFSSETLSLEQFLAELGRQTGARAFMDAGPRRPILFPAPPERFKCSLTAPLAPSSEGEIG